MGAAIGRTLHREDRQQVREQHHLSRARAGPARERDHEHRTDERLERRPRREALPLKSLEDHLQASVYKINQGDFEGALRTLEKALEFKAEEGRVHYLMADAYMLMNQPEAALENLKKAVQKDKLYSILAQNESDFEPLWEDKKFKLIVKLA